MSVGFTSERRGGTAHVELSGELDIASTRRLEPRLTQVEREPALERLVLDLRRVTFIDSTGLSLLLNADSRARKGGWRLTIVTGDGPPRRILRTVGLEDQLDVTAEPPESG